MNKSKIILVFLLLMSVTGCATKESLQTYEPITISEFEPTEEYKVDLDKIDEQNEIALSGILDAQLFANVTDEGTIEIVFTEEEANAVVLYAEDMSKVADLVEISEGYRNIVIAQAELIAVKDQTIKSLQALVLLQQEGKKIYREQFIMADTLYKQEHKIRMREKLSSDIRFVATSIGIIAVAML